MIDRADFLDRFGGVFEHSPFIAERALDAGAVPVLLTAGGVHAALTEAFRGASHAEQLGVLVAHPDLAGKLAVAGELTEDSRNELKAIANVAEGLRRLHAEALKLAGKDS